MRSLVIAVWGKNGSGRSTVASNLAVCLAGKGYLVALVGASKAYGSIQHYLGMEVLEEKSIKKALEAVNEDDMVKSFVQHKRLKDLFVMSLSNTENCLRLKTVKEEEGKSLLINTKDKFNYYIIDCTESFGDTLTTLGCRYADRVVEVIRPSIQAAAFRAAHRELIDGLKLAPKLIPVANNNKNLIDINELEQKLKLKFTGILPYSRSVERSEGTGEPVCLSGAVTRADREYIKEIRKIAALLEAK